MAITNITGQKPLPTTQVDTLDQVLGKKFATATNDRKTLVTAIIDILRQYKENYQLTDEERNIKIVDCIMKRHEMLLDTMLTDDNAVDNITTALDLNINSTLGTYFILDKKLDLKRVKKEIVLHVLDAFKKYAPTKTTTITKEVEKVVEVETVKVLHDTTANVDNINVVEVYVKNVQLFMRDLYKAKLNTRQLQLTVLIEQKKTNLVNKNVSLKKNNKSIFSTTKTKIGDFKQKLFGLFGKNSKKNEKDGALDRSSKKSLNPFRDDWTMSRLNTINFSVFKKKFNGFLGRIKKSALGDFLGKALDKVFKVLKKIVDKAKRLINSIKTKIVSFVLSLIPFVGPIFKLLKIVVVPAVKLLMMAFKVLSFAIKFITLSVFKLFSGAMKVMTGVVKGIFSVGKALAKGIYKILNSNIIKKMIEFMFTPTGAFFTGFLVGMFYMKCWQPLKDFYFKVKAAFEKDDSGGLSDKLAAIRTKVSEKYQNIKDTILPYVQKVGNILGQIKRSTLVTAWATFKVQFVLPLKNFWGMATLLFYASMGSIIGGGIGKAIGMGIGAALSAPLSPFIGMAIGSIAGWAIGYFLGEGDDDGLSERNEWQERRSTINDLYGNNDAKLQENMTNLLRQQSLEGISVETKNAIKRKKAALARVGITNDDERDQVELLLKLVNAELAACPKDLVKYSKLEIDSNKDGKHSDAYITKIPFGTKTNEKGEVVEVDDTLQIPGNYNPYGFRLVRAKLLNDLIDRFNNGLITFDLLMEFKDSLILKDADGNYIVNLDILNSEESKSGQKMKKILTSTDHNTWTDNEVEDFVDHMNTQNDASRAKREAEEKSKIIEDNILIPLEKIGAFNGIAKNKYYAARNYMKSYFMKMSYDKLQEYFKMPKDKQAQDLLKLFEDIDVNIDKMIQDDTQKALDKLEEEERKEEEAEAQRELELERREEQERLKAEKAAETGSDDTDDESDESAEDDLLSTNVTDYSQNQLTMESIGNQTTPVDEIKTSDLLAKAELESTMKVEEKKSDDKIKSIGDKQRQELAKNNTDINNITKFIDSQVERLSNPDTNIASLHDQLNINPAMEEVDAILNGEL